MQEDKKERGYCYYYRKNFYAQENTGEVFIFPPRNAKCDYLESIDIPEGWDYYSSPVWCHLIPKSGVSIPKQGWKIHVSAKPSNSLEILKIVAEIMFKEKVEFKFYANKEILLRMLAKRASRGTSGKFITIYPHNLDHFKYLIEKLYERLRNFEGPYILSDKRYKDCQVLYYRYGGFLPMYKLQPSGVKVPVIVSPDGNTVPDRREAYFYTPPWVDDPFDNESNNDDDNDDIILKSRYKIEDVIMHSNMGGIYIATDIKENKKVILKEARPYTFFINDDFHAFHILKREYLILKYIRDKGFDFVPEVYDIFTEWEHKFVVMEYIEGQNIDSYLSVFFARGDLEYKKIKGETFYHIFYNLTKVLKDLHSIGIIHGDISINNIIASPMNGNGDRGFMEENIKDKKIKIVDFEGSSIKNSEIVEIFKNNNLPLTVSLFTPGFIKDESKYERSENDDLYALGALIVYALMGYINTLKYLNPSYYLLMRKYSEKLGFPKEVVDLVENLMENRTNITYDQILELIEHVKDKFGLIKFSKNDILSQEKAVDMLDKLLSTVNNSMFLRDDLPFPLLDYAYNTNIFSLGFGVMGIVKVLKSINKDIDHKVIDWIKANLYNMSDETSVPPSFISGMAGISWVLWDLGFEEEAVKMLLKANDHPILFDHPSLFYGSAGVGYMNILMFLLTKDNYFLEASIRIADKILEQSSKDENEDGIYWSKNIGYGNGQAGIALFLLYLYHLINREDLIDYGLKALKYDLKFENEFRIGFPPTTDIPYYTTYLEFGSSGIGKVIYRYLQVLDEDHTDYYFLKSKLEKIKVSVLIPWVSSYTYFFGAAGISEFLMDIKNPYSGMFLSIIYDVLFKSPYGYIIPSEDGVHSSIGFGDGISGVIAMLYRYIYKKDIGIDIWNILAEYGGLR